MPLPGKNLTPPTPPTNSSGGVGVGYGAPPPPPKPGGYNALGTSGGAPAPPSYPGPASGQNGLNAPLGSGGVNPNPGAPNFAPVDNPAEVAFPSLPGSPGGDLGSSLQKRTVDPVPGLSDNLQSVIAQALNGNLTSFTPQVVEGLDQQALMSRDAADKQLKDQVMRSAVMSGMSRSPLTSAQLLSGERANSATFSNQIQQTRIQKAHQDFQDRMGAVTNAQNYIDQARSWILNSTQSDLAKQGMLNQMAQASAGLQMQKLQMQYGLAQQLAAENGGAWSGA